MLVGGGVIRGLPVAPSTVCECVVVVVVDGSVVVVDVSAVLVDVSAVVVVVSAVVVVVSAVVVVVSAVVVVVSAVVVVVSAVVVVVSAVVVEEVVQFSSWFWAEMLPLSDPLEHPSVLVEELSSVLVEEVVQFSSWFWAEMLPLSDPLEHPSVLVEEVVQFSSWFWAEMLPLSDPLEHPSVLVEEVVQFSSWFWAEMLPLSDPLEHPSVLVEEVVQFSSWFWAEMLPLSDPLEHPSVLVEEVVQFDSLLCRAETCPLSDPLEHPSVLVEEVVQFDSLLCRAEACPLSDPLEHPSVLVEEVVQFDSLLCRAEACPLSDPLEHPSVLVEEEPADEVAVTTWSGAGLVARAVPTPGPARARAVSPATASQPTRRNTCDLGVVDISIRTPRKIWRWRGRLDDSAPSEPVAISARPSRVRSTRPYRPRSGQYSSSTFLWQNPSRPHNSDLLARELVRRGNRRSSPTLVLPGRRPRDPRRERVVGVRSATMVAGRRGRRANGDDALPPAGRPALRPSACTGGSVSAPSAPDPAGLLAPLRGSVRRALEAAWERAIVAGALPPLGTADRPAVEIERPANPEHGDLASNLAMKLARPCRMAPLKVAEALAAELAADVGRPGGPVGAVSVAAPGFLNLRVADGALEDLVAGIVADPAAWGRVRATTPRRVNVEFVSANPTGPLHIGNARGAFVGDLLCRVLEAAGHHVTREYYFNDFGAQVRNLGASVVAIHRGEPLPEEAYRGAYVHDLAREVPADVWSAGEAADAAGAAHDAAWVVGEWASERVRAGIEASLAHLGVRFDVWKSESSLYSEGWVARAVERLRAGGHLYEQDGALWFRSTDFGDDKDRVVRKSSGDFTYFGSDVGYVVEKFSRRYDRLVYIWGADHHGTVARLRNAAGAMGFERDAVEVLLIAWVRFVRDGMEVSMSKRAGEFITLDELLAEIGVDAARWFFAARGHTSGIDFDIELAKKQSAENPVYYVQYAHARIASILRKAAEAGLQPATSLEGWLAGGPEAALARALARFPEVVEDAAAAEEAQGVTAFATDLATQFHAFYRDARVVDPAEPERSRARLALVLAAQQTLANALALLGIAAPEAM